MPSSDYGNAVGGGLKLKGGAKDAGIKKHKKKKPKVAEDDRVIEEDSTFGTELAKLEEGTIEPANKPEEEEAPREYVKTAAQRQHEERRKKRVRYFYHQRFLCVVELTCQTARRSSQARGCKDAQGAGGGAQQVPLRTERAPRHAANRARIRRCCHFAWNLAWRWRRSRLGQ